MGQDKVPLKAQNPGGGRQQLRQIRGQEPGFTDIGHVPEGRECITDQGLGFQIGLPQIVEGHIRVGGDMQAYHVLAVNGQQLIFQHTDPEQHI